MSSIHCSTLVVVTGTHTARIGPLGMAFFIVENYGGIIVRITSTQFAFDLSYTITNIGSNNRLSAI